jgi:peroxiredoxin
LPYARLPPAAAHYLPLVYTIMKSNLLKWLGLGLIIGWGGLAWLTHRWHAEGAAPAPHIARSPVAEKHYVTPKQLAASGAMQNHLVEPFAATASDGTSITWSDLANERPVVLVFIKKDCPCSVEFEPFFQRLSRAYDEAVQFVGVIDGNVDAARRYAEANKVPYPVLADAEKTIIARFKAENGGYVALLRPSGTVEMLWPGCSVEMMRELSKTLARLCAIKEPCLDVRDMPAVLTTGCPF